ncbi:ASKHA domain-containing protein [Candidatus Poriferisodalis sp.]|uniref:ASKHA domain-containing protein n=1 Tax=Candidatus Poriferisodalis sp. TaxID=3101277 RepID=UPI003B02162F
MPPGPPPPADAASASVMDTEEIGAPSAEGGDEPPASPPACTVVFTPTGRTGIVSAGITVLDAARELGVDLDSVCGGRGICGRCQVVPSVGSFPKWAITAGLEALSPAGVTEAAYGGRRPLGPQSRLGCQALVQADVVVDVPPDSQLHGPVVRKTVDVGDIALDPLSTLHVVTVPPPTLDERRGLAQIVIDGVADEWDVRLAGVLPGALGALHASVAAGTPDEAGGRLVTVAVRWSVPDGPGARHRGPSGDEPARPERIGMISAVWPDVVTAALGIAIDIGSTTLAGHLTDLHSGEILASAGRMNPQIRLGDDLMSRVSYVMMNPGGAAELTSLVRDALASLTGELCEAARTDPAGVLEVVLVGNPIMIHIALGIDPTPLGQAPFTLATDAAVELEAPELGLACPAARVYVGPAIAGHVGADTSAAVLAGGPHRDEAITLLVDVGTNAEIVLGSSAGLWAASSPTGPAFEGAQISHGQRATPGAIERVRVDPATWAPRIRVIGCDLWSDEPGFAEAIEQRVAAGSRSAAAGVTGICGSGIIEVIAEMYLAGVLSSDGAIAEPSREGERASRVISDGRTSSFVLYEPPEGTAGPTITITQNDVRAVQLAKAALRAGIDLLCERAGIAAPDRVQLAGAFGAHIDPTRAMVLGLIGDCDPDAVRSVGNAAGTGALRALLSGTQRAEMERVVRSIRKIETATEPRFQELFVAAMALPHATAPSPKLSTVIALPPRASPDAPDGVPGDRSSRRSRQRRRR